MTNFKGSGMKYSSYQQPNPFKAGQKTAMGT